MNRYTIVYYTKGGKSIISNEIISKLDIHCFTNEIFKNITKDNTFNTGNPKDDAIVIQYKDDKLEVVLKENIESFEINKY